MYWKLLILLALAGYCSVVSQSTATESGNTGETASPSVDSSADGAEISSQTASLSDTSSTDEAESSSQTASPSDTSSTDEAESSSQTGSPSDTSSADEAESSSQTGSPSDTSSADGAESSSQTGSPSDTSSTDEVETSLQVPPVPHHRHPRPGPGPRPPLPPRARGITISDLINAFSNGIPILGPRPINRGRPGPRRIPRSSGDEESLSDASDDSDLELSNVDELEPEVAEISDSSDTEIPEIQSPALPSRSKGITVADLINAFNNGIAPLGPRPVNPGRPGPRRIPRSSGDEGSLSDASDDSDLELSNVDELEPEVAEISDSSDTEIPETPSPALPPRSKGITVADLINAFNNGIAPLGPRPVNRGRPNPRRIPRSSEGRFEINAGGNFVHLNGNSLPGFSGIPDISDFQLPNVDELVPEIPEISDPSDVEIPEIPNLPRLPMIPRMRAAVSQARKNLANEIGAGQDLHNSIHDAIEIGLRSSNPTAAFRGLVSTILEVYMECALNCPVLIVGGYVMREGLLLAADVLIAIADVSAQIQGV